MGQLHFRRALLPNGSFDTAVRRVVDFFDAHSDGLCSLVEALGQDELLSLFDAALDACSPQVPNGDLVARALEQLADGLADVKNAELDLVAFRGCGPADPFAALGWYGSRLSDLSANLRNSRRREA
jgi:hypothetical protein